MDNKLFKYSIIIISISFISSLLHIIKLLTSNNSYSDYTLMLISIFINLSLLYVNNKYWRIGILFILTSTTAKHLAAIISHTYINTSIFINILGLLLLVPAAFSFNKLRKI